MNSYILLRDNKESGALGLDELKKLGLKPSDLIWVECQSVAWRNPHEIAELKPLLIAVQDTPVKVEAETAAALVAEPLETPPVLPETEKPLTQPAKKMVYVELPARPVTAKKQEPEAVKKDPLPDFHKYAGLAVTGETVLETNTVDSSREISTKYSRPLDEIKEMYVKTLHQKEQRKKNIIAFRLPEGVKKGMVYAGFAVAGAVIMLFIRDAGGKRPEPNLPPVQQPSAAATVPDTTAHENITLNMQPRVEGEYIPAEESRYIPAGEDRSVVKETTGDKNVSQESSELVVVSQTVEKSNPPAPERSPAPVPDLSSQLRVKANDYETGSFGGIRNLEMTVQNDSKYLLDKVIVEVRYLNPEGMILRTEDILFHSVYPGEAETIPVKKSKRGVKIAYKITRIESKEVGGSTTGL